MPGEAWVLTYQAATDSSFPGSAWERKACEALPRSLHRRRQSLQDSAFPGRAWERVVATENTAGAIAAPAVHHSLGGLAFLFGHLDQFLNGLVQHFAGRGSQVFMPDDALVIDDVQRRPAADIQLRRNRPAGTFLAVPEGAPG